MAGGRGSRLSAITDSIPKPLVEVDNRPILFHIMNIFSQQGIKDFVILTGYKGELIADFFSRYNQRYNNFEIDMKSGQLSYLSDNYLGWKVQVIETGVSTMTGGRLLRAQEYLSGEESFFFTYGDGLANIDLASVLSVNRQTNTVATVTAVLPPSRFGKINYENHMVKEFSEKPIDYGERINGGFFVLRPTIFEYLQGDTCVFEENPLKDLVKDSQLSVHLHNGYWNCLDTLRDLEQIQKDSLKIPTPWLHFGTSI